MPVHPARRGLQAACTRLIRALFVVLAAAVAAGCEAERTPPFDPGLPGLQMPPLDQKVFMSEVLPLFDRRGCASIHCHGSGTHPFPLTGGAYADLDFYRTADQVEFDDPPSSLLLLKPLAEAAGGVPHNAGDIFLDRTDPDYLILARWIGAEPPPEGRPADEAPIEDAR
jgi:hypothetical protein